MDVMDMNREVKEEEEDDWVVVSKEEKKEEKDNNKVTKEEDDQITREDKDEAAVGDEEEDDDDDGDDENNDNMEFVLDLELVIKGFTPGPNNEVNIPAYLKAYSELKKFIKLLGPLFHFVAYDVTRKVSIIRKELARENGDNYRDLRRMLRYETADPLVLKRSSPLSGSNALLQLHRGLDFTQEFMKELVKEDEEASPLGQAASQIYLNTTGRFHHTILAKTFSGLLMSIMPDRATILSRVAKGKEEAQETLKTLLPRVIQAVTDTYTACETLYREFDALNIDGLDGRRRRTHE